MSRTERNKEFTVDDYDFLTDKGRLVFEFEFGSIPTKKILSPLRQDKANPGFSVFKSNSGIWSFYDFSYPIHKGSYINFVMFKYNIDFKMALQKIKGDLGLSKPLGLESVKPAKKGLKIAKERVLIEYQDCPFQEKHRNYFNQYSLPEYFLKSIGIGAVCKLAINKKIQSIDESTACFYYQHAKGVKILQIGPKVERKWINNVKNDELWLLPKEKVKQLWIMKSLKDAACMIYHFGFICCAVQNESATSLDKNMPKLLKLADEIVICFGADPQAVAECKIIQQKYKTKYFNTPKYMYSYGLEDISDVIAEFGVEIIKKELKKKKYL